MKVNLTLRVRQTYPGQDPEIMKQTMDGELTKLPDGWCIRYTEVDPGMQGIITTLHLKKDTVTLTREGSATVMEFSAGKTTVCTYALDFGDLEMQITTSALRWEVSGAKGRLDMKYTIGTSPEEAGSMDYHLTIR